MDMVVVPGVVVDELLGWTADFGYTYAHGGHAVRVHE